jgi:hypothetical protein
MNPSNLSMQIFHCLRGSAAPYDPSIGNAFQTLLFPPKFPLLSGFSASEHSQHLSSDPRKLQHSDSACWLGRLSFEQLVRVWVNASCRQRQLVRIWSLCSISFAADRPSWASGAMLFSLPCHRDMLNNKGQER